MSACVTDVYFHYRFAVRDVRTGQNAGSAKSVGNAGYHFLHIRRLVCAVLRMQTLQQVEGGHVCCYFCVDCGLHDGAHFKQSVPIRNSRQRAITVAFGGNFVNAVHYVCVCAVVSGKAEKIRKKKLKFDGLSRQILL